MNTGLMKAHGGHEQLVGVMLEMFETPILFYPWAARLTGTAMGGLLLCYLLKRTQAELDNSPAAGPDAIWIEAPVDHVQAETGMTRFEQQAAKQALSKTGLLHSAHKGLPARKLYRLDLPRLMHELEASASRGAIL
jgi:hypothetical protein